MANVDDLFSGGAAAPPAEDRVRRIWRLLAVAAPLNLLGLTCFTGVPGALLTLWAWILADEERERVENGSLPKERGAAVKAVRHATFGALVFVSVSLVLQIFLFAQGFYAGYLALILGFVGSFTG